jgi:2-amino-4-hydroxy-6-hydroxymethyldihydropteridine diphosphokinase
VITAYVGIGSNLAEPRAQVLEAIRELDGLPETRLAARSPLYRSAPVGAPGPEYVNAVAAVRTGLAPERLLAALQAIEARHARERPYPNAPRTLDLDLLLYGDREMATAELTLPHPRMHERAFVLRPLVDLDAQARVPGRGLARDLLRACAAQDVERLG